MRKKKAIPGQLPLPLVQANGFAGVKEAIRVIKKDYAENDEALAERMREIARLSGQDLQLTGSTLAKITSDPKRISLQILEAFVKVTGDSMPLAALCEACGFHLIDDEQMDKLKWAEAYWEIKEKAEQRKMLELKLKSRS